MANELYIYDGFVTDGSGTVTGSLNVSGSTSLIGSNTLLGSTTLTGSIIMSGSTPPGSATASIQIYGNIRQTGYHRFEPMTANINTSVSASYIYASGSTNDLYFSQNSAGYSNVTRLRWIEGNLYSGLLYGGIVSQSNSNTYQISSGSGIIVKLNSSVNTEPYPTVEYLSWGNLTNTIDALSASYDQQFVAITASAGVATIKAQGTPYTDGDYNTNIPIGVVIHQNHSSINAVQTFPNTAYGWKQRSYVFVKAFGPLKISGYALSPSGSSTGSLLLSGGTSFVEGRNYTIDPNYPSYIEEANGITTSKIFRYYQSGSNNWAYDTNNGTGYTVIDPTKYSNNGALTPLSNNNRWSIQRVYYFPNSATKALYVYYGNAEYDSKAAAITALTTETFTEAPNTLANAIFVGYMILQKTANFNDTATYEFRAAGMFRGSGVGGGSGGGATTLSGLTDVQVTVPADGDLFAYNSTATKWVNTKALTGSYNLLGSLNVNGSLTGSLFGTASRAVTASYAINAVTSSYITTNTPSSGSIYSILLTDTSNPGLVYRSASLQYNPVTNEILSAVASASTAIFGAYNETVPLETGYSIVVTPYGDPGQLEAPNTLKFDPFVNSLTVTASYAYTASFATTASFVRNAVTASYVLNAVSASFATNSATASYVLNAVSASRASTASYVLNAVSSSFATTASFVNTLNQNVLITGSLTVGATTLGANENTLVIGPAPAGGAGEGGQLLLQAPGGTYTSASMLDNYQNLTRLLRGTNASSDAVVAHWNMHTKQMSLPAYNSTSAFSGTVVGLLAFDSNGNVITTTTGSGGGGGGSGTVNTGTAGYLAYYPGTGTTVDDTSDVYWDAGNSRLAVGNAAPAYKLDVSGDVRATGAVYANANGAMYFRGGDDAELWDINVANTVGIYGQQDQGVASIKLGSGGGIISGRSGSIGINITTPTSGALHVSGGVFATSFTGSLLGTATTASFVNTLNQNVAITGSLGIAQTTPTSRLHINANQNSVTQNDANGILLANSTAATNGVQSISPALVLQGNGWKTDATAGSQDVRFRMDVLPVQGAANPTANLRIASSINAAAYTSTLTYNSNGTLTVSQYVYGGSGVATAGQLQAINAAAYNNVSYRTTNVGSLSSNVVFAVGNASVSASNKVTTYDTTNGFVFNAYNNNFNLIGRAAIDITNLVNTSGSESADLAFQTKAGSPINTPMTTKMTIGSTGNVSILSGSLTVTAITASFINGGTDLIDLSSPSGITISTTGSGFVNINTGLTGTVRISSPLIVTGSILSLDNITAYSDASVKSNVTNIPNALNKVLEMRGVTYTRTDLHDTERIHAGVIAQELETQFPEVVYELPNGKKTVAYGNITSILIEAIKEQQKQIDDLRKQIEKLL